MEPGEIQQIGMLSDGITFATPDGRSLTAPQEYWIAALLMQFTPAQRAEICQRVERLMVGSINAYSPDGIRYKISKETY